MKKSNLKQFYSFCIVLFIFCTNPLNAQTSHGITKSPNSPFNENNYDKPKLFDRFGNKFAIEELRFKKSPTSNPTPTGYPLWLPPPVTMLPCNAGLFNIEFAPEALPTAGFYNAAYRNVVCQVFRDISRLFYNVDTNNTLRVNILVASEQALPNYFSGSIIPAGIDVVGSGFELVQPSMNNAFIDNTIYSTIRSGKSAYHNLEHFSQYKAYDYFHGYLAVRLSGKNWFTNLTAKNITTTQDDLYSAILSEALHMLGLYSQINHNGNSVIGNNLYSRYDNFLYKNTTATKVLSQNSSNFIITKNFTNLALGCTSPNNVIFNGNSLVNQSVYTSSLWQTGSNLSHFGCSGTTPCNTGNALPTNTYTLIPCRGLGANYFKRHPHQNEVKALCDIGYKLKVGVNGFTNYGESDWNDSTFGNIFKSYATCSEPCVAVGKHDTFYKPYYTTFTINFSSILGNDLPSGAVLGRFSLLDTSLGSITTNASSFTFTPKFGRYSDRVSFVYYPKCNTSTDLGNATFVTVYYTYTPQLQCENLDTNNCNYICNGTFEEVDNPDEWGNFAVLSSNTINTIDLYRDYGTTRVYRNHVQNFWQEEIFPNPKPCVRSGAVKTSYTGGNHYIGLEGRFDYSEGLHFKLRKPIIYDTTKEFRIRFKGNLAGPLCPTLPIVIFAGDSIPKSRPNALFDRSPFKCLQSFCSPVMAATSIAFNPVWVDYDMPLSFRAKNDTVTDIVVIVWADSIKIDEGSRYGYLDNFEIYEFTKQKINISTIYPPNYPCSDTVQEVKFAVCMKHNTSKNSDTVYIHLNLPAGITVDAGSDFNSNGTYKYPPLSILDTVCDTLTLRYKVSNYALHFSSMFELGIGYSTNAYCTEDKSDIFKMYPSNSSLTFLKTASKKYPSMGDTVKFNIQICNPSAIGISGLNLLDQVPSGIKLLNYAGLNLNNPNTLQQLFDISPAVSSTQPSCINFSYTGISMSNCRILTQAELTSIYNPCNILSSALNLNDTNVGTVPKATISPQNFVWCGSAIPFKVVDSSTTHTYQWYRNDTLISGATSKNYSATSSAQYSVKVSNNGCVTKVETPLFDTTYTVDYAVTDEVCTGARGNISLSPKRGIPPFNYTWNSSSLNTASRSNLVAGLYNVTVTDSIGCTKVLSISVGTKYDTLKVVFDSLILPTCTASNGKIYITTTKGSVPYTYLWNDGSSLKDRLDIKKSFYKLTVTDTNGCKWIDSFNIENVQDTLVIQDSVKSAICASSSGIVILNTTGGTMPYKYIWTSGDTTSSRVNLIPGKYLITVTDFNGCLKIDSVNVSSIPDSSFKTSDSIRSTLCFANIGAIYLYSLSGTPPYSFSWSSGHNTQNLMNIDSGIYSVIVTDTNGCQLYDTFYVPRIEDFISFNYFNDVNCNLGLATFTIEPTSGYTPHFIWWADGDTSRIRDSMTLGLYTVTVFDSIGCSTTMQVDQSFTNTILLDKYIVHPNCGIGGSIRIEPVTGIAPFTYLWDNGATDSIRSNLSSGAYIVSVTDFNGCSILDTINILPDPNPSTIDAYIKTKTSCQSGIPTQLQAIQISGNPNVTYQWSTGANTANISITNNSAKYTVTITEPNGCKKIISTTPHVDSFLRLGDGYGGYGYEDLQSAIAAGRLSSTMLSKLDISIKGKFTLNANADIRHCNIIMSEAAGIDVPSDCNGNSVDSLTMLNNQIYTCGTKLAHGIAIRECSQSGNMFGFHLRFTNNEIKDCYKALEIRCSMIPHITDNLFEDNMIGIHIFGDDIHVCTPFPQSILLPTYLSIYGNKFRGSGTTASTGKVKIPYNGLYANQYIRFRPTVSTSTPYGVPLAGIIAENTRTLQLGHGNAATNIFENLNNGILTYGSELYVYNTLFRDMLYKASTPMREYAIYSEGNRYTNKGSLILGGYSSNALPHVSNVLNGVYAKDLENTNISGVYFKDVRYSIYSESNYGQMLSKNLTVRNNKIEGSINSAHKGIEIQDNTADNFYTLIENNILTNVKQVGIRAIKNNYNFINSSFTIQNNTITGDAYRGIHLMSYQASPTSGASPIKIIGNNCRFNHNMQYGIHYSNCKNISDKENTVKGSDPSRVAGFMGLPANAPFGFFYDNSTGTYSCNLIDSCYTGARFFANCDASTWSKNKIKNHRVGLKIDTLATLKDHYWAGNSFSGLCFREAQSNQRIPTVFYYSNLASEYLPSLRFPSGTKDWWKFLSKTGGSENDNCNPWYYQGWVSVPIGNKGDIIVKGGSGTFNPIGRSNDLIFGIEMTTTDTAILMNNMVFGSFEPELTWQYRKDLYDKIKPYEFELRDTSIFRDYLSQMEDGSINEFTQINVIDREAYHAAQVYAAQVENLRTAIDSGWEEIKRLDSAYHIAIDSGSIASLKQLRTQLRSWIWAQDTALYNLVSQADSAYQSEIEQIQYISDSIIPECVSDSLRNLFLATYYQTYAIGQTELTALQIQTYTSLANHCPFEQLDAVYRSRGILWSRGDTSIYNDSLLCAPLGITLKSLRPIQYKPIQTKKELSFSLFPNPTKGLTNIQLSYVPSINLTYIVTDILGRELYKETRLMDSNRHTIDMQRYENGVYLLRVLSEKEVMYHTYIQVLK